MAMTSNWAFSLLEALVTALKMTFLTCRFMAERNYRGFLSEPVRLNTADLNLDRSGSVPGGDDGGTAAQPNGASAKAPAKRNGPLKKSTARKPGRSSGAVK